MPPMRGAIRTGIIQVELEDGPETKKLFSYHGVAADETFNRAAEPVGKIDIIKIVQYLLAKIVP